MKPLLTSWIAVIVLAWGWSVIDGPTLDGTLPWVIRQHGLHLSGLLAIAMMSLAMYLATRPRWLETPLGGMDRVYRTHKWAGILAGVCAVTHWLIELSDGPIKSLIGRGGRVHREKFSGLLDGLQHLAKDLGEWAIYALLAMLAITLWRRFPYRRWRLLHRVMPLLYLLLAFHAAMLIPTAYWQQPAGWLLALLLVVGSYGSVCSLTGSIGRARQSSGEIVAVERPKSGVLGVTVRLSAGWSGHRAGQFAFVTFEPGEGAHPFTIASADHGDRMLNFQIKELGDYTRQLDGRLRQGQSVTVEGPYGRFELPRRQANAQQIWIAGGIGVTPFLAWLEALHEKPEQAPTADLHYCTANRENDPFVARLHILTAGLPSIHLQIHGAQQGEQLTAEQLIARRQVRQTLDIWFCGPAGFAQSLRAGLRQRLSAGDLRFHQEAFVIR